MVKRFGTCAPEKLTCLAIEMFCRSIASSCRRIVFFFLSAFGAGIVAEQRKGTLRILFPCFSGVGGWGLLNNWIANAV